METVSCPLWNTWSLKPPEIQPIPLQGKDPIRACIQLSRVLNGALEVLENQNLLSQEAVVVERLIYRLKRVYRHGKTLQTLQKLKQALKKYVQLNLYSVIKSASDCTYEGNAPPRQGLHWCLVNLQRFAALFYRIRDLSQILAADMNHRVYIGQMIHISVIVLGVASRLWSISTYLVRQSVDWYDRLKPFLNLLPKDEIQWLPYKLPPSIYSFLGKPSFLIDKAGTSHVKSKRAFDPADPSPTEATVFNFNEDVGEIIDRSLFKKRKVE